MGMTLGIAALIIVSSVMNGFEDQLKQRILGLQAQVVAKVPNASLAFDAVPGVIASSPYIESQGMVQSENGIQGVEIQGVVPEVMASNTPLQQNLLYGDFAALSDNKYHVLIGYALARELAVRPGDKIRILLADTAVYSPFGSVPVQRLFTIGGVYSLNSELDSRVIVANVEDIARLKRKTMSEVEHQRLFLADAFEYQAVSDHALAMGALKVSNWRERQGKLFDAVKMEKNMMALMLFLIILVAAFNIVSSLAMVVGEKRADIAILLTQGMLPTHITQIFVVNGLYNGLKGVVLGLLLGLGVTLWINEILGGLGVRLPLPDDSGLPVLIEPFSLLSIALGTLLVSFVASLYPARRAAAVQPANALRYE